MKNIVIKEKGVPARILLIILTLSAWFFIIYSKDILTYFIQSVIILTILTHYSFKAGVEIYFLRKLQPFVFYKENQICVRLSKFNMIDLDIELCRIQLSCHIDGKKVWSQKENSTNLCFIPSVATEKTGKDVIGAYSKIWVVTVEAPLIFNNHNIFDIKVSYTIN